MIDKFEAFETNLETTKTLVNVPNFLTHHTALFRSHRSKLDQLLQDIRSRNVLNDNDLESIKCFLNPLDATRSLVKILNQKIFNFHRELTETTRLEEKLNLLSAQNVVVANLHQVEAVLLIQIHDRQSLQLKLLREK